MIATHHPNSPASPQLSSHCPEHHPRSHDPLTKPALLLFGTAVLSLALVLSGSFKLEEAGVIATASAGGGIACLMMDRNQRQH